MLVAMVLDHRLADAQVLVHEPDIFLDWIKTTAFKAPESIATPRIIITAVIN